MRRGGAALGLIAIGDVRRGIGVRAVGIDVSAQVGIGRHVGVERIGLVRERVADRQILVGREGEILGRGDWQDGRQSFTSGRAFGGQDETYLSWRDRQIAQFDRDYEDYCRERGQDFGTSFDSWRRSRRAAGSGTTSETEQPDTARSKG